MDNRLLLEYAKLIVKCGANVRPNQLVIIKSPIEVYEFTRLVVEEAYKVGAKKVIVDYIDSVNDRHDYLYESVDTLTEIEDYTVSRAKYEVDNQACHISLTSPNPLALAGVDPLKLQAYSKAKGEKLSFLTDYTMNSIGQWCVAGVASKAWANKVFPNQENNVDLLWEAILKASHVSEFDSVSSWMKHSDSILEHAKLLNSFNFKKLSFKNSKGTDLEVYLALENIFAGGDEYSAEGVRFSPNIPTEEVFGMPYKTKVNGIVYSTKPLNYQGSIIEDFYLRFKDGKVVEYNAKKGFASLKALIEFDDGSSYLGEVALISHNSPISNMNVLFYNTLFDENASCHLALGQAYSMNTKAGTKLSKEELIKRGCNFSNTHIDFMFGSKDMSVIGTTYKDEEIVIFKDGNFII